MSESIFKIDHGSVNPYDRRRSKFFKRLINKVADLKEGEQLQVRINSYSMVTKAKLRIYTEFPFLKGKLEIFSRKLTKGHFLYVRWKDEE